MSDKMTTFRKALHDAVISKSDGEIWETAVMEWDITDYYKAESETCVCGQQHIKHCFILKNRQTDKYLNPIGSDCIKKFGREDLNKNLLLIEDLIKLKTAMEEGKYITLSSDYFTARLIQFFARCKVIDEDQAKFLLEMFRRQRMATERQQRYINCMIMKIRKYMEDHSFNDYAAFI